jgi:hypothetical protein
MPRRDAPTPPIKNANEVEYGTHNPSRPPIDETHFNDSPNTPILGESNRNEKNAQTKLDIDMAT